MTLEAITVANGWQQDVRAVVRAGEWEGNLDEWPALVLVGEPEQVARHVQFAREHKMSVRVGAYLRDPDTSTRQTKLDQLQRDVIAAVMADETRGGYAAGTDAVAISFEQGEASEPEGVSLVALEITYRTRRDDPAVQAVF